MMVTHSTEAGAMMTTLPAALHSHHKELCTHTAHIWEEAHLEQYAVFQDVTAGHSKVAVALGT